MSLNVRTRESMVPVDQDIEGALALALHKASQPLTVIQGTLELAQLTANTIEHYKIAVERSLEEVRRLTDCFAHLRTLICPPQSSQNITEPCGDLDGQRWSDGACRNGRLLDVQSVLSSMRRNDATERRNNECLV